MDINTISWSPVLRYATPLPMNRTHVSTVALQNKSQHFFCPDTLPCERRCSWWVPAVRKDKDTLPSVQRYRWWVQAVRGRIHFFARNKEALPCCGRGPSCQPLHVQYSSDGSCSLTILTTPRGEHHGGGRWRGLGRGRRGAGEDAAVEARAERSTRVHWFGRGVRLPSPQGLASGGNSRGR